MERETPTLEGSITRARIRVLGLDQELELWHATLANFAFYFPSKLAYSLVGNVKTNNWYTYCGSPCGRAAMGGPKGTKHNEVTSANENSMKETKGDE
ncbi:hypothetical protein CR513_20026, partial [Mucuna pruriens]